jgi:HEAT repeat protein
MRSNRGVYSVKKEGTDRMTQQDNDCYELLQACLSEDLQQRLNALKGLLTSGCLEMKQIPFLLERLKVATLEHEKAAILKLLVQFEEPLPEEILETLLESLKMLDPSLLSKVINAMAPARAEKVLHLLYYLLEDYVASEGNDEDPDDWQEAIPAEVLFVLLAHPETEVCLGALDVLDLLPSTSIPVDIIRPYCSHKQALIREAALRTLCVAEQRAPVMPFLAALQDPEPRVRAVASHACMFFVEWHGESFPLKPLVQALDDKSPQVREDLLDALGKAPERAPVEPVVVALSDSCLYVRCAAVETLGLMSPRVPLLAYPMVRAMAEVDPDSRVRERAKETLLEFSKFTRKPRRKKNMLANVLIHSL